MKNGEIIFAIEEERINRIKHYAGFPAQAIKECLIIAKVQEKDITDVAFNTKPFSNLIQKGIFFLKKPGKIRFSYDPPQNLQIVSKQQAVLIFDPKNRGGGPLTYPLSSTPLGFLIKNDLNSFIIVGSPPNI